MLEGARGAASSWWKTRCDRCMPATACWSASRGVTALTRLPSPGPRRSWYRRSLPEDGLPSGLR
jgi:hypothetical protein